MRNSAQSEEHTTNASVQVTTCGKKHSQGPDPRCGAGQNRLFLNLDLSTVAPRVTTGVYEAAGCPERDPPTPRTRSPPLEQQQPISFFSAGGARQEQGSARYAGGCHYRRHATRRRRWAPRFGRGRPPGPPPLSLPGSCGSPPLPAADLYFPCIGELCSSPALAARGKGGQGREQRRPRTPLRVGVSHGGCGGAHRRRSRLQLLAGGD